MMLSVCSAAPSCSSILQISLHAGSRSFHQLQKAVEDGRTIDDKPFCLQDVIHAKDISFKAHANRLMHPLIVEKSDQSGSTDSSIFSPYSNDFDDIVREFSDEVNKQPENLSCSVSGIDGLHPLSENLKYMENLDVYEPNLSNGEFLTEKVNGELGSGFASGDIDLSNSINQSLIMNDETSTILENPVEITDAVNITSQGSLNLKESVNSFLSGVTESVDRAQGSAKSSYSTLVSSFTDVLTTARESFDNAYSGLFSSVDDYREQATKGFTGLSIELKDNVYKTGIIATDLLRRGILTVDDSLSKTATFVVYSYGSAKTLLPTDIRNALNISEEKAIQILSPVGAAFQQVYLIIEGLEKNMGLDPSDPLVPFLLLVGSSATIGISYWFFKYGGYSGDIDPESTLDLLKNEKNAVLIDVRPEDLRERDGVPDLRRAARSKYASVSLPELDGSLRKQLKGGKDIDDSLIAVVIQNLKVVEDGSRVIVMDASGTRSKAIARSLVKLGVKKSYLVEGGFQSWVRKGLRIKELKQETTLSLLNEEAEAILEDIRPTSTLVIGYGLGIIAFGYALLEWEKTLQVIGLIGIGQTLYRRFSSYENAEDFEKDVRVTIRGQTDEEAVLCTPSSTYAMKFVGTSNSVFLIPPENPAQLSTKSACINCNDNTAVMESVASVLKLAPGTIELTQAAPRLDKLKSLLNERPYSLEEDMEDDPREKGGLYSWQNLVELIQASEEELRAGLRSLSAVEIYGYWRTVSNKSMDEVLNMILNNSILYDWPQNALEQDQVVSALQADGFPQGIVLHCLETYGSKTESMGRCLWSLDEKRVCLHFALRVLSGGKMKLESFMEKWLKNIPSGMNGDLNMLEGEVLYEKIGVENWIRAFSVSALSTVPAERFAELFRERPKWEWKDLEPYIRNLRVPGLSAEALLIKYTRRSQPNPDVEPIFSAR